jgi:hypothetical protein
VAGTDHGRQVAVTFGCGRANRRQQWLRLLRFSDLSPEVAAIRLCCKSEQPPTCHPRPPRVALAAARRLREQALRPTRAAFWARSRLPTATHIVSGAWVPGKGPVIVVLAVGRFPFVHSCPLGTSCPTTAAEVNMILDARTGREIEGGGGGGPTVQDVVVIPDLNRLGPVHDLLPYVTGACA